MRQSSLDRFVLPHSLVLAAAFVGWSGSVAFAAHPAPTNNSGVGSGEPRYWAGDVSFVTQATYLEEVPSDDSPAEAEPMRSQPAPALQRPVAREPDRATAGVTSSDGTSLPETDSAPHEPSPLRAAPTAPAAEPTLASPPRRSTWQYGGRFARPSPVNLPRRMQVQLSAPQPAVPNTKPFELAAGRPTLSPYLNLFREETEASVVPDYFTYVRPQLEQQQAMRFQQQDLEHRERRTANGPAAAGTSPASAGTTRRPPAHFMNTAQFYSGWQR